MPRARMRRRAQTSSLGSEVAAPVVLLASSTEEGHLIACLVPELRQVVNGTQFEVAIGGVGVGQNGDAALLADAGVTSSMWRTVLHRASHSQHRLQD